MKRIQQLTENFLAFRIGLVLFVVFVSIAIMIPLVLLAEALGVPIRENTGLNFEVSFGSVFFFFLFGACSVTIIALAQKFFHGKPLHGLGFRGKVIRTLFLSFLFGAAVRSIQYLAMMLNATEVTYTSMLPENVPLLEYLGYYLYFFIGFLFWNSFIEELGTRAYPIKRLKKSMNPHLLFAIIGVLFTAGHFVLRDFELGYCISLFATSYVYSLLYHYSGSIWLVIGMHSGTNWIGFTFSGSNWRLGALMEIQYTNVHPFLVNYGNAVVMVLLLLLLLRLKRGGKLWKQLHFQSPE